MSFASLGCRRWEDIAVVGGLRQKNIPGRAAAVVSYVLLAGRELSESKENK